MLKAIIALTILLIINLTLMAIMIAALYWFSVEPGHTISATPACAIYDDLRSEIIVCRFAVHHF